MDPEKLLGSLSEAVRIMHLNDWRLYAEAAIGGTLISAPFYISEILSQRKNRKDLHNIITKSMRQSFPGDPPQE